MGAGGLGSSCVSTLLHGTGFFAGTGFGISLKLAEASSRLDLDRRDWLDWVAWMEG